MALSHIACISHGTASRTAHTSDLCCLTRCFCAGHESSTLHHYCTHCTHCIRCVLRYTTFAAHAARTCHQRLQTALLSDGAGAAAELGRIGDPEVDLDLGSIFSPQGYTILGPGSTMVEGKAIVSNCNFLSVRVGRPYHCSSCSPLLASLLCVGPCVKFARSYTTCSCC
jgi:hypothetical protein